MKYKNLTAEEKLAIHRQQTKDWIKNNQAARLYQACKNNAKKRNVEFTIDLEDVIIPEKCLLLGVPLTNINGQGRVKTNASIDRVDPSKGYIKSNIRVISDLANRMKQNATETELIAFAKGVLNCYDRKTNN